MPASNEVVIVQNCTLGNRIGPGTLASAICTNRATVNWYSKETQWIGRATASTRYASRTGGR